MLKQLRITWVYLLCIINPDSSLKTTWGAGVDDILTYKGAFSNGHSNKGATKKNDSKILLCLPHQPSLMTILAENHGAHMLSSPMKTLTGMLSRTKSMAGGSAILCHQALTRISAVVAAAMPACPESALSVTNIPTVGMDQFLVELCFKAKLWWFFSFPW